MLVQKFLLFRTKNGGADDVAVGLFTCPVASHGVDQLLLFQLREAAGHVALGSRHVFPHAALPHHGFPKVI